MSYNCVKSVKYIKLRMQVMLTAEHLCLVMELAAGGTLMAHVSERHSRSRPGTTTPGLSEDEARYYFTVRRPSCRLFQGLGI